MRLFPESAGADAKLLICAKGLRAVGDGFVSILLPAYLLALGYSALEVGIIATSTLLGSALLTMLVGMVTSRFGHRGPLLCASALMVLTGIGFAGVHGFWPLLLIAFVGTLNPSSGDVSVFLPIEHSLLSGSVGEKDRTAVFARYSLAGGLMGAFGTLLAAIPDLATGWLGISQIAAMQGMFLLYAVLGAAAGAIYRRLPDPGVVPHAAPQPLGPSRGIVYRLAALFGVDAFAGGFLVQSILALWLFQTYGLPLAAAANIFFWTGLLAAVSYLIAVEIARRIGLVNTMVFTHLPANLCIVLIPFVSDLYVAVALLMVRSLLSQMDVPTRTSYVMAVVTPPERPAAASLTAVPRSLASAISPTLTGAMFAAGAMAAPLVACGVLKIAYDLALYAAFRRVGPRT